MTRTAPFRCSTLADELGEPMLGTTEQRVRWLLVEDRGAWGEKAVRDVLGAEAEATATALGLRLLLVRRRAGDPAADVVRRAVLVDTERGEMAIRTVEALGELDVRAAATMPLTEFGAPMSDPILLVCTNGRRDACCSLRGRMLVASLAADHAERTWECTHLGGHRFAANLVCLPDGIVYGRVTPADGPRLADAYLAGRVQPALLRGRSAWPPAAQVVEGLVRTRLGLTGLHDLRLVDALVEGTLASVTLATADGRSHAVHLRAVPQPPPRPISCRADEMEEPVHWQEEGVVGGG